MLKYTISLGTLLPLFLSVSAQSKAETNGLNALKLNQYERALGQAENAIKDEATAKSPLAWFIKANALFELQKNEKYTVKNPSALKDAVKSALKARNYDKSGRYTRQFMPVLRGLKDANNKEAWSNYGQEKYFRAIQSFKFGYDLSGDTLSYSMTGVCYMKAGQERDALPVLREAVRWQIDAFRDSMLFHTFCREPFEMLGKYYMERNLFDSARYIAEYGMKMFPKNAMLASMQVNILKHDVETTPISDPFIEAVNKGLQQAPADSFFLYNQNAYYLFRIRNAANAGDVITARKLLERFVSDKAALYKRNARNSADFFLLAKPADIANRVWKYYAERNAFTAAALSYKHYLRQVCGDCKDAADARTWTELDSLPVGLVHAWTMLDERKVAMQQFRLRYFNQLKKDSLKYNDLAALNFLSESLLAEYAKDAKTMAAMQLKTTHVRLLLRWMDMAMKEADMSAAWVAYRKLEAFDPASFTLPIYLEKLVTADFRYGYFETRVKNYAWNGSGTLCNPGTVSDEIQKKVEERINFFRRNAGVLDPIILSPEKNRMCQQAALAWEVTGTASHEIDKFHRCFTEEANLAARNSIPVAGVNTVIGVTSAMDDNDNPSCGNRRWLLNPQAYALGHGSSKGFTALWVLDDAGNRDSSRYKNSFIAWPNKGFVAKRLLFDRWSFGCYENLEGATVKMTDAAGKDIPCEIQPYSALYPLSTLVWKPAIDVKTIADKSVFKVQVKSANGKKTWNYTVTVLDLNPS
ncbi:MAG: hypothetical protein KJS92_00475 [Bacteroidetes bacterium]|nr:hypothetical protein [Bacteroidota bacterium]